MSYENLLILSEEELTKLEALSYAIATSFKESEGRNPSLEKLSNLLCEVMPPRIARCLPRWITSGEFYLPILNTRNSLWKKLGVIQSLVTGPSKRDREVIPTGDSFSPTKEKIAVASCLLATSALLANFLMKGSLNFWALIGTSYFPILTKVSYAVMSKLVRKRLGLRRNLTLKVERESLDTSLPIFLVVNSKDDLGMSHTLIKSNALCSAKSFKKLIQKKGVNFDVDISDLLVVAVVNIDEKWIQCPIKDCLPITYPMILGGKIERLLLERMPAEEISNSLLRFYKIKYPSIIKNDIGRLYFMLTDKLPGVWIKKRNKVLRSKDPGEREEFYIQVAIYYCLLRHEDYQEALLDYVNITREIGDLGRLLSEDLIKDIEIIFEKKRRLFKELEVTIELTKQFIGSSYAFTNNPVINALRCFCEMEPIPYVDEAIVRLVNRFYYGISITDLVWLRNLLNSEEVHSKLRRIIPQNRTMAAKINEALTFLAHRFCREEPQCRLCPIGKFCQYAKGRRGMLAC